MSHKMPAESSASRSLLRSSSPRAPCGHLAQAVAPISDVGLSHGHTWIEKREINNVSYLFKAMLQIYSSDYNVGRELHKYTKGDLAEQKTIVQDSNWFVKTASGHYDRYRNLSWEDREEFRRSKEIHVTPGSHGRIMDTNLQEYIAAYSDSVYGLDFAGFVEMDHWSQKQMQTRFKDSLVSVYPKGDEHPDSVQGYLGGPALFYNPYRWKLLHTFSDPPISLARVKQFREGYLLYCVTKNCVPGLYSVTGNIDRP